MQEKEEEEEEMSKVKSFNIWPEMKCISSLMKLVKTILINTQDLGCKNKYVRTFVFTNFTIYLFDLCNAFTINYCYYYYFVM